MVNMQAMPEPVESSHRRCLRSEERECLRKSTCWTSIASGTASQVERRLPERAHCLPHNLQETQESKDVLEVRKFKIRFK